MELTLDLQKLNKAIEALLFVAKKPLTIQDIQRITGAGEEAAQEALNLLLQKHNEESGLKILKVAHGFIMGTDPECADFIDKLVNVKIETTLSPQALETLAIIAYNQPLPRLEIESIRGVFSDGVIETLLAKNLIEERGRSKALGRPILYGTTVDFLKHFGLKDTSELPNITG